MTKEDELDISMLVEAKYIAKVLAESDELLVSDDIELEKAFVNSVLFHRLYRTILKKAQYIRYYSEDKE